MASEARKKKSGTPLVVLVVGAILFSVVWGGGCIALVVLAIRWLLMNT